VDATVLPAFAERNAEVLASAGGTGGVLVAFQILAGSLRKIDSFLEKVANRRDRHYQGLWDPAHGG
jgi:hypothetical protein